MPAPDNSISVAANATTVFGTNTLFVAAPGDIFFCAGNGVPILARPSASQLTLSQPWPGASVVDSTSWDISNVGPDWHSTVTTNQQLNELLRKFEAGPIKWDAAGAFSERGSYNNQGKGFVFLSIDPLPFTLYVKLANTNSPADWSAGQSLSMKADSTADAEAARDAAQASASTAGTKADIATGAASTATGAASVATGAAGTATTQAGIATGGAGTATAQAGIATSAASQTATDRSQTSADRTQTGADRVAADASAISAALSANNAASTVASSAATGTDDASNALVLADLVGYVIALITSDGAFRSKLMDFDNGRGGFSLVDPAGNLGLLLDAQGLQAPAVTAPSVTADTGTFGAVSVTSLAVQSFAAALLGLTDGSGFSITSSGNGYDIADPNGFVLARFDASGLTIGSITLTGALNTPNGLAAPGSFEFGAGILTAYDDPNIAFVIADAAGWIVAALTKAGRLQVQSVQTSGTSSDYTADEIAERNARALALAAGYRGLLDTTSAAAVWAYNHVLVYGQSLGAGVEGWPAKTLAGRPDVLMIGQSARPGGANSATSPTPLGDTTLRAAVATAQDGTSGALLTPSQQAALSAGDASLGEEVGVAGMLFARRLFLQRAGLLAADDRRFVVTNVAVGGQTVEQLSKGASPELFNRLRVMANAVKTAAGANSYGIAAVFWLQGEWNYSGTNGGATDKASYKANLKQLRADINADVATGIAAQADPPAFITYQTGGQYTVDATDMSIGQAQWELSLENPGWYLAAPSYPVTDKNGHLDPNGYRWLAMQFGKVFHETVILRRRWKPLSPLQATVRGRTVLVDFHVPAPPLQFQPVYVQSVATSFTDRGFTLIDDSGVIPLLNVGIVGDAVVRILLGRDPVGTVKVYYARKTTFNGHGNLCDSDPTVAPFAYEYTAGSGDYAAANIAGLVGSPYPLWNWCIAFVLAATAN